MRLALHAWRLREAARRAIEHETYGQALRLAGAAERLHSTPRGESLLVLSAWLNAAAELPLEWEERDLRTAVEHPRALRLRPEE
jgi:hypothetical protein